MSNYQIVNVGLKAREYALRCVRSMYGEEFNKKDIPFFYDGTLPFNNLKADSFWPSFDKEVTLKLIDYLAHWLEKGGADELEIRREALEWSVQSNSLMLYESNKSIVEFLKKHLAEAYTDITDDTSYVINKKDTNFGYRDDIIQRIKKKGKISDKYISYLQTSQSFKQVSKNAKRFKDERGEALNLFIRECQDYFNEKPEILTSKLYEPIMHHCLKIVKYASILSSVDTLDNTQHYQVLTGVDININDNNENKTYSNNIDDSNIVMELDMKNIKRKRVSDNDNLNYSPTSKK